MLITSINNKHIKELAKLKDKKYRDMTNTFLVETKHLVEEAYREGLLQELILLDKENYNLKNVPVTVVSFDVLKKLSTTNTPNSIMGVVKKKEENSILGNKILVLDNIQDPGNLGTIIRSSVAFNFDTLVLSTNTVDLYNPKVIRATEGMLFKSNIIVKDLLEFIPTIKDKYTIYGTNVVDGINLKKIRFDSSIAIVIGNEGNGISEEVSKLIDKNIYISMNSACESLNVGVAASIIMYEVDNNAEKY